MTTSDGAQAEWRQMQNLMPDLLADRQPILVRSENAKGVHWGVRTAGFAGRNEAKGFCSAIKARGVDC